ncbi:MAG: phosphotransferase family protein, partial [Thermomicrobiales bacterium]
TDLAPALTTWLHRTLRTTEPMTIEALPSRSDNRSYRLQSGDTSCILKVVHPKRAAAVAHELAILPYLHQRGFPVSDVLGIASDLPDVPETAVLRTYVAGAPASERFITLDAAARGQLLAAMGALLARVHALPLADVRSFWQFPEDTVHTPADWSTNFIQKKVASDLGVLAPSGALAAGIVAQMAALLPRWAAGLAETPVVLVPLHGDFYLDNLLVTDDGAITGLLDWEAARLGDPLWELARTQIASFSDTPAEYNRFLAPYSQHIPLAIDEGRVARYRFLMVMGDLRYAVRRAPELTTERAVYLTRFWRQLVEAPGWS